MATPYELKNFLKDGEYDGPGVFPGDAVLILGERCTSLMHLHGVTGRLQVTDPSLVEASNLERVSGILNIQGTNVVELPRLQYCSYMRCTIVPFCPDLTSNNIVEYDIKGSLKQLYRGGLAYYGDLREEVLKTKFEMLVPLRLEKPHLANLIDFRLKGDKI